MSLDFGKDRCRCQVLRSIFETHQPARLCYAEPQPGDDTKPLSSDGANVALQINALGGFAEWLGERAYDRKARRALFRQIKRQAAELLDRYWIFVERIANKLLLQPELNRSEIDHLLRDMHRTPEA